MTRPPIPIGQTARRVPEVCEDCGEPLNEDGECEGGCDENETTADDVAVREGLL